MKLYGEPVGDLRVEDICQITYTYASMSIQKKLVHKGEFSRFVDACLKLHFDPGINPHNGNKAARVVLIEVHELRWYGPFWWSTPDLQNNGDPAGARILQEGRRLFVWRDEEYYKEG